MCGIAGIFNLDGAPVDPHVLIRMTRTLIHRGPDEEGYFLNRPVSPELAGSPPVRVLPPGVGSGGGDLGLGHRRLSIIDLATGQQPLSNEDGSVWVCFNGEIYNFQQLQEELKDRGHRLCTHSDTEVIVHAYEEWGERAAARLRGMFAVAVWDERRRRLWMARDRVGKKPLYHCLDGRRFVFGSEIKALLEVPGIRREISPTALADYLSLLYVPGPKTIYRHIRKLPAAHYAIVDRDGYREAPYWDLSFQPDEGTDEERCAETLLECLEEATRLRMISDVPLGAFLSGGVDSSAVVGLMARASDDPVITNSISFSVSRYDESAHARRVAELFGTDHHEYHVTPEAIPAVEFLSHHYDEPFADSSSVPTYYVSRTARRRVVVALSGDGGDENFAGYRRYYFDLRENLVRDFLPFGLGRPLFRVLGHLYPKADFLPRIFRGRAFLSNVAREPIDAYFFSMSAFDGGRVAQVLSPDVLAELGDYRTVDLFREIYTKAPAVDHLSRIQYLDVKTYLCDDILTKVDRASMAVSLEVRCPILDHVFMEQAARIPSRWKLSGTNGKRIFKKALQGLLPDDILHRRKMGFGVPILEWLRGELSDYARRFVMDGEATRALLNRDRVATMWLEHQRGLRNWATELWALMILNLWYERFGPSNSGKG